MHEIQICLETDHSAGDPELIAIVMAIQNHAKQAQSERAREDALLEQFHAAKVNTLCTRLEEIIEDGGV